MANRKAHSYAEMSYLAWHQPDTFKEVREEDKKRFPPRGAKKKKNGASGMAEAPVKKTASESSLSPGKRAWMENMLEKRADKTHSYFVVEHDPENGSFINDREDKRYRKSEVYYRRGEGKTSCRNCVYYEDKGCARVLGDISPDARCRLFEEEDDMMKQGSLRHAPHASMSTGMVFATRPVVSKEEAWQGILSSYAPPLKKTAESAGQSVGANLASMLDGEVEENKLLREEIARLRASIEMSQNGGGEIAIPSAPPPGSTPSPVEENAMAQQAAQGGAAPQGVPPQGPQGMGQPPMPPAGPNPGMGGVDPTGQMPPGAGPAPMTGQPVGGLPPGGIVDPNTGMPAPIDPRSGMPMMVDPTTGQQMPIDPNTGAPIDPMTGQPMPPPPTPAEQQLQTALQQLQGEIEQLDRENKRLEDENRALHHAIDPDDMNDRAKRMYSRAGTLQAGKQEIPLEGVPRRGTDRDLMRMLIGQDPEDLAINGPQQI